MINGKELEGRNHRLIRTGILDGSFKNASTYSPCPGWDT
jgi:hypothetical protein